MTILASRANKRQKTGVLLPRYNEESQKTTFWQAKRGPKYPDSQSSEAMAIQKGTPTKAGEDSPFRNRSVEVSFFGGMASVKIGSPVPDATGGQIDGSSEKSALLGSPERNETNEFKKAEKIIGSKHMKSDEYDSIKHADGS